MLETRVLDRINFFCLQIKGFRQFFEFILSKTRAPDRINFFSLQAKGFQQNVYPIWVLDSDRINFFFGGGGWGPKMLKTRVLDRINFFCLQNKAYGPFFSLSYLKQGPQIG